MEQPSGRRASQLKWSTLKTINKVYVFRLLTTWLAMAPLFAHATKGLPPELFICTEKIPIKFADSQIAVYSKILLYSSRPKDCAGEVFSLNLTLSFNVYLSVLAALLMLAGYILFQWKCPPVVKSFDNFSDFKAQGGDPSAILTSLRGEINRTLKALNDRNMYGLSALFRYFFPPTSTHPEVRFELHGNIPAYATPVIGSPINNQYAIRRVMPEIPCYTLQEMSDVLAYLKTQAPAMFEHLSRRITRSLSSYCDEAWHLWIAQPPLIGSSRLSSDAWVLFEKPSDGSKLVVTIGNKRVDFSSPAGALTDIQSNQSQSPALQELIEAAASINGYGIIYSHEVFGLAPLLFGQYSFKPKTAATEEYVFNEVFSIADRDLFSISAREELLLCSSLTFSGLGLWIGLAIQHLSKLL